MDKHAEALTKHASFLHISHGRLKEILTRNSLCIREIDLYRTTIRWARAQLKRANKRRTHQAIREVLGEALFLIRFPTMHPQEFANGPAKDNILSAEEKLAVYDSIHRVETPSCAFSAEPRTGVHALPLRRFTPTYCQPCGARLNGDLCPECGCSYHSPVECAGCGRRIFVGAETFARTRCHPEGDSWAVASPGSSGTPNATRDTSRNRCGRCGLKAWWCGEDARKTEETCYCYNCKKDHAEDYSDCELASFEDYSDVDDADNDDEDDDE